MTAAAETRTVSIESIDLEGQGVARSEGKVVFVRGALTGERVSIRTVRRKPRFDQAEVIAIERSSVLRVAPRCPHFGVCGGCSLQHLDARSQLSVKQRALEDTLWHIGKVRAQTMLRPLMGPAWGYRLRARLTVRYVAKKGGVLVGFHERGSSYVADMRECHVLPPAMSDLLLPLRELVGALSIRDRMPQIEVAIGQGAGDRPTIALVLRILAPLTAADETLLREFALRHRVEWWLQRSGPDTIELLDPPAGSALAYRLDEFGLTMPFRPTDFTQVNHQINEVLVSRAIRLLDPQPGERAFDMFCGLGNFSLPLARRGARVLGVEGSAALVERARAGAAFNGLAGQCTFAAANLFEVTEAQWAGWGQCDRLLLDPPREGALAIAQVLATLASSGSSGSSATTAPAGTSLPRRIVYISCNPATLARDLGVLVNQGGWQLRAAGVVNMFPHTSHVESMAVLEPPADTGPDTPGSLDAAPQT